MADRALMGMLGAREVPEGEDPDLHAMVARLASRAQVVKPRLYVIERGPPLGLAAGRGVWASTVAFTSGPARAAARRGGGRVRARAGARAQPRHRHPDAGRAVLGRRCSTSAASAASSSARCSTSSGRWRRHASTSSCRRSASSRQTVSRPTSASRRTGSPMPSSGWSRPWSSSSSRRARRASRCSR